MNAKDLLQAFFRQGADFFLQRFNRLVPFGDMVVDRWEKARLLGFGEGTSVYDSCLVLGKVSVGKNVWIGPNTVLDGFHAPLCIGDNCCISAGSQIYTHNSVGSCLTGGKKAFATAATTIGDNVYIGPLTVVSQGVTIGNHTIVGAHSLVTRSIPAYCVAWGQPAQIKGNIVFDESKSDYQINYT